MMDQDEAEAQQTPRTLKQLKCENEQKRKAINEVQRKLERLQEEERELEAQIAENKARIDELMGHIYDEFKEGIMEGAERALKKYFDGKVDPEFEEFFQNDDDLSVADYALRSYLTLLKWEKRVYTDDAWTDEKKRERCLFGFLSYFRNLVILDSLDVLDCRLKYVLRLHMQLSKIEPSFVKRKKFYILLVLFLRARIDPPSGDPDRSESDADDESETATQKRLGRALVGLVATLRALKEAKAEEERTEQGRAEIIKENADLDKQLETFSEKCESIRERVTALQAEKDRQEELIDELSADVELERILQITLSSETEENQAHFVR